MARLLLLLAVLTGTAPDGGTATSPARKTPRRVEVSGTASRLHVTSPCMGGAAVTEEMIQRDRSALSRQALTIFTGSDLTGAVAASVTTDAGGRFAVRLRPGRYCIVVGAHAQAPPEDGGLAVSPGVPTPRSEESECLARLANPTPTCTAHVDVQRDAVQGVEVTVFSSNQCPQAWAQPCYRGPMPP